MDQIVERANGNPVSDEGGRLYVPTGATLLNLALSDRTDGGFLAGKIINIIGDSSSGKTFLSFSLLGEVSLLSMFGGHRLIYDDAESANEFDLVRLFGQNIAERIEPPARNEDGEPVNSRTIQDFQANVLSCLKRSPCVYVLDSLDALTSDEEMRHAEKQDKARAKGEKGPGTYGMEKAKHASILLRLIASEVKKTKSLVVIISQTRDNIDPMSFQRKTRAGGKALTFYASYEIWTAVERKIHVKVGEKSRTIGVVCKAKISKNKATGKVREVSFPIYYDYGVDDIGSCVDFLVSEKAWIKSGTGKIDAGTLRISATRDKLIRAIEDKDSFVYKMKKEVAAVWKGIEDSLRLDRKPKYERS
uniref:Putative RecA n=1 Tax=viral metagenome TaxID=1070528 RepID=A0A6M3IMW0_9ZZZZ